MTSVQGLRRLRSAAELDRERRSQALRRIDDEARVLRVEAEALRRGALPGPGRLEVRGEAAGIAIRWDALRERRLAALGQRIARLEAQRAIARFDLARACGRLMAIRRLIKDARN